MNIPITVNQTELLDVLLNVAITRPVFIWGAPGIGKSSIVESFARSLDLPCVSMLGSQLAPEDIIGVPQITDGYCDKVILHGREHAFLVPQGTNLPFVPKGKVFRMR